ncbi:MAG: methyltransferase domain-containing protein [Planctomycetes bacterium]|nr:methyltransferase domain-containing protein [Planctomycetota bacterium]
MPEQPDEIRATVLERFSETALTPEQVKTFPLGPDSAKSLGYDAEEIDVLPSSVTESFCGVGNPLGLGELQAGQIVLDLGSGSGMDSILAARRVGRSGKVVGVDMTEAMIEKARSNAAVVSLSNIEFIQTEIDRLPLDDESVDVAITNGVFNLCPDKRKVLAKVFRVLRPGGRLQMADILLHDDVTPEEVATKGSWSD